MNSAEEHLYTVEACRDGLRLDLFLSEVLPSQSRSFLQKCIERQNVLLNGLPVSKNERVKTGDAVFFCAPEPEHAAAEPEPIDLDIIYEDDDLLVVNKPKGMVVHPAPGNYSGTLVNGLLHHCDGRLSGINGVIRPGIVHRIDKDTSGLLVVAKNDTSHNFLAEQIKSHTFTREYEAVVHGHFKDANGTIDAPIGRSVKDRKKMSVNFQNGKSAVTRYSVIAEYLGFTHVSCRLETGRTHQIRVHMSYTGHPLAGDALYGKKDDLPFLHGQCLHAKKLGFVHPTTHEYIEFDSPLPDYFRQFLSVLENESGS